MNKTLRRRLSRIMAMTLCALLFSSSIAPADEIASYISDNATVTDSYHFMPFDASVESTNLEMIINWSEHYTDHATIDLVRPRSLKVGLFYDEEGTEPVPDVDNQILSAENCVEGNSNQWRCMFEDLPIYKEDGEETYKYFAKVIQALEWADAYWNKSDQTLSPRYTMTSKFSQYKSAEESETNIAEPARSEISYSMGATQLIGSIQFMDQLNKFRTRPDLTKFTIIPYKAMI